MIYLILDNLHVIFVLTEHYNIKEYTYGALFDTSQLRFGIENVDGSYTIIEPAAPDSGIQTIPYSARLGDNHADQFAIYSDTEKRPWEVLLSSHLFYMPSAATHIELWYRENTEATFQMVRRVALENLFVYKTYVIPKI